MRRKWSTIECPDPLGQGYRSAWLFGPGARLNASPTLDARIDQRIDLLSRAVLFEHRRGEPLSRAVLFEHRTGEYAPGGGWS
jgi:hypothetical protein